jgi:Nucleotidyltransferase domain.
MFEKPTMQADQVEIFLDKFVNWASFQPDILGIALVGSYARNAATESSDVDLVILVTDPQSYLQDQTWVRQFGEPTRLQTEVYGSLTSIRAWYPDGGEIEYGFTDETWAAVPLDEGTRQVIAGGMRVLFEREPILSRHLLKP